MKNYPEREVNNARRQLLVYEQDLKEVENKVADLEVKNQQYTHDLILINKVNESHIILEDLDKKWIMIDSKK